MPQSQKERYSKIKRIQFGNS
uniref:Uncharacterized protein n=1 Tax=Arundo donax TaxID=35708 RepID=A0A0A8ZPE3_ARUDO